MRFGYKIYSFNRPPELNKSEYLEMKLNLSFDSTFKVEAPVNFFKDFYNEFKIIFIVTFGF